MSSPLLQAPVRLTLVSRRRRSADPIDYEAFQARVEVLRRRIGELQEGQGRSAELAGIAASTWSRWKKDADLNPTLATLQRIADALRVPLAALLAETDEAVAQLPPREPPPAPPGPNAARVAAVLKKLDEARALLVPPDDQEAERLNAAGEERVRKRITRQRGAAG
jgi:transcriptional regulator with XRE-family HTH domain